VNLLFLPHSGLLCGFTSPPWFAADLIEYWRRGLLTAKQGSNIENRIGNTKDDMGGVAAGEESLGLQL